MYFICLIYRYCFGWKLVCRLDLREGLKNKKKISLLKSNIYLLTASEGEQSSLSQLYSSNFGVDTDEVADKN